MKRKYRKIIVIAGFVIGVGMATASLLYTHGRFHVLAIAGITICLLSILHYPWKQIRS
jgi:hypothetical protein